MRVKLLTEHYFEILSLKGCCTGSSESTLVKMPHCWKSLLRLIYLLFSTRGFLENSGCLCSLIYDCSLVCMMIHLIS